MAVQKLPRRPSLSEKVLFWLHDGVRLALIGQVESLGCECENASGEHTVFHVEVFLDSLILINLSRVARPPLFFLTRKIYREPKTLI